MRPSASLLVPMGIDFLSADGCLVCPTGKPYKHKISHRCGTCQEVSGKGAAQRNTAQHSTAWHSVVQCDHAWRGTAQNSVAQRQQPLALRHQLPRTAVPAALTARHQALPTHVALPHPS